MKALKLWQYGILSVICLTMLSNCGGKYAPDKELLAELPQTVDYNFHVQPILSDRCYRCHGPDENARKGDLRLDDKEGLYQRTSSGEKAVNPGAVSSSEIMDRITSNDPDYMMPPPGSNLTMTDKEIATLAKWIDQGAAWKPHWSYIPPVRTELPQVKQTGWPINEIDYYVLSSMEKQGFQPKPAVEKEILLRRVTFDLTGLPPNIEEIDNFLADQSENAYEKVVDRLLTSPVYGENMAVDWLDLARYADTHGYQADFYRPHWPWRDWVIKAFNTNMRFDQFVTWQLAGDLLPKATKEQILATGFNRNHAQNNEGGIVEEEFRVEYVADRTQTFGTAFLGLTLQCSRCHDHKYDPISQKEFYQLFAFFNNVDESGQTTFYQPDLPGPTMLIPTEQEAEKLEQLKKMSVEKHQEIKEYVKQKEKAWDSNVMVTTESAPKGLLAHYALERPKNEFLMNQVAGGKSGRIIDPVNSKLAQSPPYEVMGAVGKGLKLSGDDALSFPGLGRFSRWQPFSVGLWIKVPADVKEGVIFHSNKGSALYTYKGYQVSLTGDRFEVRLAHNFPYNSIHLLSEEGIPRDQWVHILLTYDGSSTAKGTSLFMNGEPLAMEVKRDNLYKDMVFHPQKDGGDPPVDQHLKVGARWRGKGFTNGEVDEIKVYGRQLTALEVKMVSGKSNKNINQDKKAQFEYDLARNDNHYQKLVSELQTVRKSENQFIEKVDEVMVMDEMEKPRSAYLLDRGVYDQQRDEVQPGTPASVLKFRSDTSTDRLGLAQWLFDAENPLPSRVTVNRFWQHYFGSGLVHTADDFGSQGERPSHPELLDWLALEFIESGWNIKQLQKTIVMSATYRQSSMAAAEEKKRDVNNRLLARGPSSRLKAEMMRDLVLAASGLLVNKIGGPSVKPYQPAGLWSYNAFSSKYEQDHGDDLYRRSLYTFWKRTNPPPSMNILDAPSRSYCVVRREQTETPLQALVLMNDPQFVEAARVLGQRVMKEGGASVEKRITLGFRLLTGITPSRQQVELLEQQFQEALIEAKDNSLKARAILTTGEYGIDNNFDINELIAYTKVMSTIMNFEATTMKR